MGKLESKGEKWDIRGVENESGMDSTWEMRRVGEKEKGGEERNGTVTGREGEWNSRWKKRE